MAPPSVPVTVHSYDKVSPGQTHPLIGTASIIFSSYNFISSIMIIYVMSIHLSHVSMHNHKADPMVATSKLSNSWLILT